MAFPSASSESNVGFHGSPGPRVHRVTRTAPGTVTIAFRLPPRRTVFRSTVRRTGACASRQARTGCQNAAARPEAGAPATKRTAPSSAAAPPAARRRRVVRRNVALTSGAANETNAAARVSAASSSAALMPLPLLIDGLTTPTTLPARPPVADSTSRPTGAAAASRRARQTAQTAAARLSAIRTQASVTPETAGASTSPSAAAARATPRAPSTTAKARPRAWGAPRRCSRRAVSVI